MTTKNKVKDLIEFLEDWNGNLSVFDLDFTNALNKEMGMELEPWEEEEDD